MTQPLDADEWGNASGGGEFVAPAKLEGHLLIVYPTGYVPHIQTVHSRPDKLSDAIKVDVIDLDDVADDGQPGKVYRNSNWMQSVLIASLRPEIGRKVLGVMGKGVGKKGFNAPWVLTDMSGDPAARERAGLWLKTNPQFAPSRFVDGSAPASTQLAQGYSPTPQASTQGAATPTAAPAQGTPSYHAVPGSPHKVTAEEMSLLQQLREQRAARAAQPQDPDAPPPF